MKCYNLLQHVVICCNIFWIYFILMSTDNTMKYYNEVYRAIADLYVIDKLSLPAACAKVKITTQTYYRICRKLNVASVSKYKDARLNFISSHDNKLISERNNIE